MPTAEATTTVATGASTMTASAVLRPQGYSQEKGERRDGQQATHTRLL
jgi:hypothetical protein